MKNVYPEKQASKNIEGIDKEVAAGRIITAMDSGLSKAQAIGDVLKGSDDIDTFNELWDAIEAEGKALRSVDCSKYETEEEYLENLPAKYLDKELWLVGLLDEKGVADWDGLLERLEEAEL